MPDCPHEADLHRHLAGRLPEPEALRVVAHLDTCSECAQKYADLTDHIPANSLDTVTDTAQPIGLPAPLIDIAGYEILREIRRGGQGVVYKAVQTSTKRLVAIKVLLEGGHASSSARRRFEREIELIANLKHPNLITIFDSGVTAQGHAYYVMDYVGGATLTQHVRDKQLSVTEALELFADVCDPVDHAHQKGIIHRDLKPSNILVDASGDPKVLDFGLAKIMSGPAMTLVSTTGQVLGTLPYMSPEQAVGKSEDIDGRTDVYALGVILYEMLTGEYPYPVGGQMSEVLKHISETPPTPPSRTWKPQLGVHGGSLRKIRRGQCPIGSEVETIAMKALAKEPARRYQSPRDLALDIRRYLRGEPIAAKRDSSFYIMGKALSRHRIAVVAATLVVAIVVVAGGLVSSATRRSRTAETAKSVSELCVWLERNAQTSVEPPDTMAAIAQGIVERIETGADSQLDREALAQALFTAALQQRPLQSEAVEAKPLIDLVIRPFQRWSDVLAPYGVLLTPQVKLDDEVLNEDALERKVFVRALHGLEEDGLAVGGRPATFELALPDVEPGSHRLQVRLAVEIVRVMKNRSPAVASEFVPGKDFDALGRYAPDIVLEALTFEVLGREQRLQQLARAEHQTERTRQDIVQAEDLRQSAADHRKAWQAIADAVGVDPAAEQAEAHWLVAESAYERFELDRAIQAYRAAVEQFDDALKRAQSVFDQRLNSSARAARAAWARAQEARQQLRERLDGARHAQQLSPDRTQSTAEIQQLETALAALERRFADVSPQPHELMTQAQEQAADAPWYAVDKYTRATRDADSQQQAYAAVDQLVNDALLAKQLLTALATAGQRDDCEALSDQANACIAKGEEALSAGDCAEAMRQFDGAVAAARKIEDRIVIEVPAEAQSITEAMEIAEAGSRISLAAGRYREAVHFKCGVQLVGAGMDEVVITADVSQPVVTLGKCAQAAITGVTIEHSGTPVGDARYPAVYVEHSALRMSACRIRDAAGDGVRVIGSSDVLIEDSVVESSAWSAMVIAGESARATLRSNRCSNNARHGIEFRDGANGTATANEVLGNAGSGFAVSGAGTAPELNNNTSKSNGTFGIVFRDDSSGNAGFNTCQDNGASGIAVVEATPELRGNTCMNNTEQGILFASEAQGKAVRNTCRKNQGSGIGVFDRRTKPVLFGNDCEDNEVNGIEFGDGAVGSATKNKCSRNRRSGIEVYGGRTAPDLEENTCTENELHGILFSLGAEGAASVNRCERNQSCGIYVHGRGTAPDLRENRCDNNLSWGIAFERGKARPRIAASNRASGNRSGDIQE